MGRCLDLTTAIGISWVKIAYESLAASASANHYPLPANSSDLRRRNLDCAVIRRVHEALEEQRLAPLDTVKGIFTEGQPIYPQAGFREKTYVQIAVRNTAAIKGVFRIRR